ncbi:MAG: sulfoxide reductase heme-binding subunit YedZ [candidate division NC10 bacterium]|nr:sulfoxide reductase heme-binding subunit YedZ [candidate division NC10 bacterium]
MGRKTRIALKAGIWTACLLPLAFLIYWAAIGDLTVNPIDFITRTLGDWTMRILLASLALTPLRILTGAAWPVACRRLLGLFAFFYAALHFGVWIVLDHFFDWPEMLADILKRRYITVGMLALVLLLPLAATSTNGMVRRLGGKTWQRLHRLVYCAGVLAVLHYLWLAKVGFIAPYVYAAILTILLGVRLWGAFRRRLRESRGRPAMAQNVTASGARPLRTPPS